MLNVQDYELRKTPNEPQRHRVQPRATGFWVAAGVLIVGIAVAAYIVFGGRSRSNPATGAPAAGATAPRPAVPAQPLGGDAAAIDLPPLAESDVLVRELVSGLSSHPSVAAWLATDNLIRNFTAVVANIPDGRTPARHLSVLRPSSNFRVIERGNGVYVDPKSYERYNTLAAAATSLDPAGSAKLYSTLKPRIEEAYKELGANTPFDHTLERAIVTLLSTPVVDYPPRVEPRGVGFVFADPKLEGLTPPQKQLLRLGPKNQRAVQASLREIALALGIPADRLPVPRP